MSLESRMRGWMSTAGQRAQAIQAGEAQVLVAGMSAAIIGPMTISGSLTVNGVFYFAGYTN